MSNPVIQIPGGASTFSEKASKYSGIQQAKLFLTLKITEIAIQEVEKNILETLYQIEILKFSTQSSVNAGLPQECIVETTTCNDLCIAKLTCQIETLNAEKRILEHTYQNFKKESSTL